MSYIALSDSENFILGLVCAAYLLLFIVYFFVFIIYARHVYKLTLHINLKLLLFHIPIPCLINMCAQVFQRVQFFANIEKIRNPFHVLIVTSDTAAFANLFQLDVLIIERMFATIWVSQYEEFGKGFPFFGAWLLIAQWLLSIATFVSAHIENFYKYVACFIGVINVIIAIFVFIFLPRISFRIHNDFLPNFEVLNLSKNWKSTLTQRYQSCENLKVATLIKILIVVELFSVLGQIGIHAAVRSITPYTFNWYIVLHSSYFNLSIHSLILMLIVILPCFSTVDSCKAINKIVVSNPSPEVVNKIYFDVYTKAWA